MYIYIYMRIYIYKYIYIRIYTYMIQSRGRAEKVVDGFVEGRDLVAQQVTPLKT